MIRYEDLVNNPTDSLHKLCDFMGLNFNDKMLNFQNLAKDIKKYIEQNLPENEYSKLKSMHHNLENTITENRVNVYKNELSKEEISILDSICYKTGNQFGYLPINVLTTSMFFKFRLLLSELKIITYYHLHSLLLKLPLKIRRFIKLS
ncbi:MAG: sulfotransferase domain-containing protein [Bacteroidetes bacterium]|nr:sulfotransferase domain-containing protein [Bacteroidota bacterium]